MNFVIYSPASDGLYSPASSEGSSIGPVQPHEYRSTRETYDEFFPRNFNLPLFVIVLFLS